MKAIVFHEVGDIRLDTVPEPKIKDQYDAIVRLTASAICGTDLHFVRGTVPHMVPGTVLGHEGVGIVEEVGKGVRNLRKGDRVVIPSTIACGSSHTVAPDTTPSAMIQIPTARTAARPFSAARKRVGRSMDFKLNMPVFLSPTSVL